MAELSTLQTTWIHLLSSAINGMQADREKLLQINPQELFQLAEAHKMLAVTAFALNTVGVREPHKKKKKTKALRKLALKYL